jgi:chromosome segregation protein
VYLAELEIQGFKSFAHRTKLAFTRSTAAIVGPNGSGKSNVADAIRWVLGEQSMKLLRGKRAEDVIFAGSDRKARLSMAEVSLRFDNSDGRAPIDASELSVSRRVYRDGTGEYRINGQSARLADVLLLLARCSVGQRTYAVIGQGMADAFLSASPLERKVYFDEAAGVRQFQLKREQAVSKLDRTRENLSQAELLVNEIEPRLRSLTRAVKRLERREVVEVELHEHQQRYYGSLWNRWNGERKTVEGTLAKSAMRVAELERAEASLNHDLAGLVGGGSELARLEAELGSAQSAREQLVRESARVTAERHAALASAGQAETAWIEQRIAGLTEDRKRAATEHTEAQTATAAAAKRLAAAEKKLIGGSEALKDLKQTLNKAQSEGGSLPVARIEEEFVHLTRDQATLVDSLRAIQDLAELPSVVQRAERFDASLTRFGMFLQESIRRQPAERVAQIQSQLIAASESREGILVELAEARTAHASAQQRTQSLAEQERRAAAELAALERQHARADDPKRAAAQEGELTSALAKATERVEDIQEQLRKLADREENKRSELTVLQGKLRTAQGSLAGARTEQNSVAVERARLEQRLVDLEREMRDELSTELLAAVRGPAPTGVDPDVESQAIARLKHQRDLIGGIDEGVAAEYQSTNDRYQFLTHQIGDLTKALADLETAIAELDATIKKQFDESFERINTLFQKYFRTLFGGGAAKLIIQRELKPVPGETADGEVPSDEETTVPEKPAKLERVITGIEIHANPPGKKLKSIQSLSGGERALTSIALLSAIIAHNPSPFVVLDEVDAALDEANSHRFSAILAELSKKTQFIAITHNRATMEYANLLYGVTMGDDGISRLLSVRMEDAEKAIAGTVKK